MTTRPNINMQKLNILKPPKSRILKLLEALWWALTSITPVVSGMAWNHGAVIIAPILRPFQTALSFVTMCWIIMVLILKPKRSKAEFATYITWSMLGITCSP